MATGSAMGETHERTGTIVIRGRAAKTTVTPGTPVIPEPWKRIGQIGLVNTWTAVATRWHLEMLARQTYHLDPQDNRNETGREILGQTDRKID